MRRFINPTGSYDFPVGTAPTGKGYQLANFDFTAATDYTELMTYFDETSTGALPGTQYCGGYAAGGFIGNGKWVVTPVPLAPAAIGTYDATLYNRNYTTTGSAHTIVKSPSGLNTWSYPGNCGNTTANATSRTDISSGFSDLATIHGETPLNAQNLRLAANPLNATIRLEAPAVPIFETASELRLMRGASPNALTPIQAWAGGEYTPLSYDDRPAANRSWYYQLQALDADGSVSGWSNVVSARLQSTGAISVWPNPTYAQLFVQLPKDGPRHH